MPVLIVLYAYAHGIETCMLVFPFSVHLEICSVNHINSGDASVRFTERKNMGGNFICIEFSLQLFYLSNSIAAAAILFWLVSMPWASSLSINSKNKITSLNLGSHTRDHTVA